MKKKISRVRDAAGKCASEGQGGAAGILQLVTNRASTVGEEVLCWMLDMSKSKLVEERVKSRETMR